MSVSADLLPAPPAYVVAQKLRARQVPEAIVEVTRLVVGGIQPAPDPQLILDQFSGPAARHVKEAYRSGERDYGRLAFLVSRHILHMPSAMAWGSVPRAAQAFPGRVSPAFLAEAEGHVRDAFGAMAAAEANDEDRYMPFVLIGLAVAALCTLPVLFGDPPKKLKS